MMGRASRLEAGIVAASQARLGGLLPYITAGYPDLGVTRELLLLLERLRVAAVEVGFPYSDSIADGPTIANSYQLALQEHLRVDDVFACVAEVRRGAAVPLVAMVSFSIVHRRGVDSFCRHAREAGFDGLIIPDLSLEEAPDVSRIADAAGLDLVMLVAPTSSPARRERIARLSRGFVYYLSVAGVTGERAALPADLARNVELLRACSALPICVGFGISRPAQVRAVCEVADGAIVGSALVRRIGDAVRAGASTPRIVEQVGDFVGELLSGTAPAPAGAPGPPDKRSPPAGG